MAITETINIGGKDWTARPLTLGQVIEIETTLEDKAFKRHLIDDAFVDGLPSLALFTSLKIEAQEIESLTLEQVKELMEAVAKVNPTYASRERHLLAQGRILLEGLKGNEQLLESLKGLQSG